MRISDWSSDVGSSYLQKRERLGIQATAQMRPFDNLTITANYFRFELKGDYRSNTIKVPEWGYGNFFTGATLDPSGTIFTGASFEVPPEGTECRVPGNMCTMETPAPRSEEHTSELQSLMRLSYAGVC